MPSASATITPCRLDAYTIDALPTARTTSTGCRLGIIIWFLSFARAFSCLRARESPHTLKCGMTTAWVPRCTVMPSISAGASRPGSPSGVLRGSPSASRVLGPRTATNSLTDRITASRNSGVGSARRPEPHATELAGRGDQTYKSRIEPMPVTSAVLRGAHDTRNPRERRISGDISSPKLDSNRPPLARKRIHASAFDRASTQAACRSFLGDHQKSFTRRLPTYIRSPQGV